MNLRRFKENQQPVVCVADFRAVDMGLFPGQTNTQGLKSN